MVEAQSSEIGGAGDVLIMKDSGKRVTVFRYLKNNCAREKDLFYVSPKAYVRQQRNTQTQYKSTALE